MGKKKNKVVDLKSKAEKVSEQELSELQSIVNALNSLQIEIGKLEAMKHQHLHSLSQVNEKAKSTQDALNSKYGTYDVSLVDGTLNYSDDDQ